LSPRILSLPLCSVLLFLLVGNVPGFFELLGPTSEITPQTAPVDGRPSASPSADAVKDALARAEALRRIGEREAAVAALQPFADHADPTVAAEVGYRLAELRLESGFPKEAAGGLESILARFPQTAIADRATFLLGVARRQAGDCVGSIDALLRYSASASLLAPYASLQIAQCYQQLGDPATAVARAHDVFQQTESRRLRIESLERQAGIFEGAGDLVSALARYEQLVDLARDRSYKTDMRLAAARLNVQLGQGGNAAAHLAAIVNEAPSSRGARDALDRLAGLGALDLVSYYQAGLVRYFAGDYAAAERNFSGALATPGEAENHPGATYYRAVSRVRLGAEIEGAQALLGLPGAFPASRFAPDALLRGGKILESNGHLNDAALAYWRTASDYSTSDFAAEALFRLGFVNLLQNQPDQARAAWGALGSSSATSELRTLGLLWQGKMASQAGDVAAARAQWQQAVDIGPTWYGGMRARGLLEGQTDVQASGRALDPARVEVNPSELAELDAWTGARGIPLATLVAEQAADPAFARVDELLALGLQAEASWEIDDLSAQYAGDGARLAGLALALHQRGLDAAALRQAQQAVDTAKVSSRDAPAALQKVLYPLPYQELFQSNGARFGVDPLFFASMVRQESMFQPTARSVADARGLTQVVPGTAQGIATALGRSDFKIEDLYRPSVSLEFGAFYLGQRLQRFGGALFPSLAGYNAGDGAADRWIRDFGLRDVDVFVERIPYAETNRYVKVIFENYGVYQALYGAR
jgi:soluble lytic murein transglycosylase